MKQFIKLMQVALVVGVVAGTLQFALQHLLLQPIIAEAERYEAAAASASPTVADSHEDETHRTALTALATVLEGIGFAAMFFGVIALLDEPLSAARGVWCGVAGFLCVVAAPALGIPPYPPGVDAGELLSRQQWWLVTAAATATGLFMLMRMRRGWRIVGALLILLPHITLPHIIGAADIHIVSIVPIDLIHRFQVLSILTNFVFWITLGSFGGYLWTRSHS